MGVSHVIRGDDHLNNAFRQLALIRAMDWPEPVYAHIPLIHGADGAKLSKRHGALGVDIYRDEMGLLPEAVDNYLLRLGWGHGDAEIISRDDAIRWFDLANIGRPLTEDEAEVLLRSMASLKVRAKNINELADSAGFLFRVRPVHLDEAAERLLEGSAAALLGRVHGVLAALGDWTAETTEAAVREVADEAGVGLGKVAQPLRAALTGQATSPGIFDVLVLLGRDESLARIADQVAAKRD
jgi:glutamyl-tRNA synthetase